MMPRAPRLIFPDYPHHVVIRGNNRNPIFTCPNDQHYLRDLLYRYKKEVGLTIHHYCLMTNHLHFVPTPRDVNVLSTYVKKVLVAYVQYYKHHYDYSGHFVQDRFKSIIIDSDTYFLQAGKYIELNPVRAGLVQMPEDYEFSSYRFYACGEPDALITPNPLYLQFGGTPAVRQLEYRKMVIDETILNTESFRTKRFIGSDEFVSRMEKHFGVSNILGGLGRPRRTLIIPEQTW